jgi:hypothetical protein
LELADSELDGIELELWDEAEETVGDATEGRSVLDEVPATEVTVEGVLVPAEDTPVRVDDEDEVVEDSESSNNWKGLDVAFSPSGSYKRNAQSAAEVRL